MSDPNKGPSRRVAGTFTRPARLLRRSRRGRWAALPALALSSLGLVIVLAFRGALSASILLFPEVLVAAAAWVAHFLSRERQ